MDDEFMQPTLLTVSTERPVITAQLRGAGEQGDNETAEPFDACEVLQPQGFMANPALTATSEALTIRRGDEAVVTVLIDKGASAQNVESGETRVHGVGSSNQSARIRIRNNGAIEITTSGNGGVTVTSTGTGTVVINSAAAVDINSGAGTNITLDAGANVVLNGGVLQVARATDPVQPNLSLLATLNAMITLLSVAPAGSPVVSGVIPALGPTIGTIQQGALTVLA